MSNQEKETAQQSQIEYFKRYGIWDEVEQYATSEVAALQARVDEAEGAEAGRWQDAIYELCKKVCREWNIDEGMIDGGGCDSGDPLDLSLSEIKQAIDVVREAAVERAESAEARVAELERDSARLREAANYLKHRVMKNCAGIEKALDKGQDASYLVVSVRDALLYSLDLFDASMQESQKGKKND